MNIETIDIINHPKRVFKGEFQGKSCFVKKRVACRRRIAHHLQGMIAKLFRSAMLSVTVPEASVNLVSHEAQKIERLRGLGLRVPEVYYYTEEYMVLEDCGVRVKQYIEQNPERGQEILDQAAQTLGRLHAAGDCHGGAQIRNFTVKDEQVYMIDFEEKISDNSKEGITYRDLLFFLTSIAAMGHGKYDSIRLVELYQSESGRQVVEELARTYVKLCFILIFKPLTPILGRDYRTMLYLLHELNKIKRWTETGRTM